MSQRAVALRLRQRTNYPNQTASGKQFTSAIVYAYANLQILKDVMDAMDDVQRLKFSSPFSARKLIDTEIKRREAEAAKAAGQIITEPTRREAAVTILKRQRDDLIGTVANLTEENTHLRSAEGGHIDLDRSIEECAVAVINHARTQKTGIARAEKLARRILALIKLENAK